MNLLARLIGTLFLTIVSPVVSQAEWIHAMVLEALRDKLLLHVELVETGLEQTYSVGRGDAMIWEPGDKIRGEQVPFGTGYRLQNIRPDEDNTVATLATFEQRLRQNTKMRGTKAFRSVGEYIPKFVLIDQFGEIFYSESLKGSYSLVNFIFTRCQMQNMCPAATLRMTQIQQLAKELGIKDLKLVSITLDPDYDTAGIFHAYMKDKGIDPENFKLLGGSSMIVEDLKSQLGVLAEKDPEQIIRHTLTTTLIDPTGKVIYRIPGSMWEPQIFLNQIQKDKKE